MNSTAKSLTIIAKIKWFLRSQWFFLALCAVGFLYFYLVLARSGILTHDELQAIAYVREGIYLEKQITNYINLPRGLFIIDVFIQFLQYNAPNDYVYRLYDIFAFVCVNYCLYRFIKLVSNKYAARIAVLAFFITASISIYDHNGFISFGWSYKLHMCYFFIVLECLVRYIHTDNRRYLIASVILYVISSGFYESFVMMCVPIASVGIYETWKLGKLRMQYLLTMALPFVVCEGIYLTAYFYITLHAPAPYEGTTLNVDMSPLTIVNTTLVYMNGLMPFVRIAGDETNYNEWLGSFTPSSIVGWIITILLTSYIIYSICNVIRSEKKTSKRDLAIYALIMLASAFSITLPFGLSAQYVNWAQNTDTLGYGCSLFSYFLIIAAIVLAVCLIAQLLCTKLLRVVGCILVGAACIHISTHVAFNNVFFSKILNYNAEKYTLFDTFVRSEVFKDLESGDVVYAPEYMGIHLKMNSLTEYGDYIGGNHLLFTNDGEAAEIDYELLLNRVQDSALLYTFDSDGDVCGVDIIRSDGVVSIDSDDQDGMEITPPDAIGMDEATRIGVRAGD